MTMQARRIIVHGMVQGVGFRYFAQRIGKRLGLVGNICNLADGTVEIVVEGDPLQVANLIREVRKGPPSSYVERLEAHDIAVSGRYQTFMIEGW